MTRLEQLLSFQKEDPTDSFIRFALASEYVKLDRPLEALSGFNSLKMSDPEYVGLYYHLGKLMESMDNISGAKSIYGEGIEIAAKLSDFHARSELQSALLEAEGFDEE